MCMKGGLPVQEGSRKGLGRGSGRGFLCRNGGGLLWRKGVPRGFLGRFLCRKGGVPEWHAHDTARTLCLVPALKLPSPCIVTTTDPWQPVLTTYLARGIVNPPTNGLATQRGQSVNPLACAPKGLLLRHLGGAEDCPGAIKKLGSTGLGSGGAISIRYT